MIQGVVTEYDVPQIMIPIAGREWKAIVDTGFNGFLELPEDLKDELEHYDAGPVESELAANQVVIEQSYDVVVPFDGRDIWANVTFLDCDTILLGTKMIRNHELIIDFPNRTVQLARAHSGNGQMTTDQ